MDGLVSLRLVQSSSAPTGTGSFSYKGSFQIVVENADFTKAVGIWAKVGSTWKEIAATYTESVPGNLEIWIAPATDDIDRFAVKCTVLGNTYWDNNAGWDYAFPKAFDEFNAITGRQDPVVLGQASIGGGQLAASIAIQNLAFGKVVGVIYTLDDWATNSVAYANYQWTMSSGLEVWHLQASIGSASEVKLAAFYFVLGNEYWDNNFWRDYTITPTSAFVAKALIKHRKLEPWAAGPEKLSGPSTGQPTIPSRDNPAEDRSGQTRAPIN